MFDELTDDNAHLAVVTNTETGEYHGAVYQNHPKPSGLDRWLLRFSTKSGYATEQEAANAINADFPQLRQLC